MSYGFCVAAAVSVQFRDLPSEGPSGSPAIFRDPGSGTSDSSPESFRTQQSQYLHSLFFPARPSLPVLPSFARRATPPPPGSPSAAGPPRPILRAGPHRLAPSGPRRTPPSRAARAAAAVGAAGGGAGARLRRGPAPPHPTLRPSPPLSRALPLSAAAGSALGPARHRRPPRLSGLEGRVDSRQGGGTTPPRGVCSRPASEVPLRRAGRQSGARRRLSTPALSCPPLSSSSPPPALLHPHPPRARTPRGREGAALGADKGAGWAGGGCGRHARPREGPAAPPAVRLTPAGRRSRPGVGRRRAVRLCGAATQETCVRDGSRTGRVAWDPPDTGSR